MPEKQNEIYSNNSIISNDRLIFPVVREYIRCTSELSRIGIFSSLMKSENANVIGIDGKEYPLPTQEQVTELFSENRELVNQKFLQGFDRLEVVPLCIPLPFLLETLKSAILLHEAESKIFRTRQHPEDPLVPVRVNGSNQVWIWDTLLSAIDNGVLQYFPEEYSSTPHGQSKSDIIHNGQICAFPGWSVGIVESQSVMPGQGQGRTLSGRKQLETGLSPREYLQILKESPYRGESGITLEEFVVRFLAHLEATGEVSNDIGDCNAVWCLGQYLKISYAELVPTGRWIRDVGRVRLDMHRTGNKECTKNWGAATSVRLVQPEMKAKEESDGHI